MDAQNLFRVFRDNILSVVVFALLGLSAGLLLASLKTPEYTAEAEVFVTVTNGGSTNELAQGSNYAQQQARNFSAVATREIVLGPVLDELRLPGTVSDLRDRVHASVPLNTSLISIDATDSEPAQAAAIANSIAKNLSEAANSLAPQIEDVKGSPVRLQLVENAVAPDSPSVPNVLLWVLLGAAAGIVIGVGWVAIRELVVAKVRTKEQVDTTARLNHLGSISFDRDSRRNPIAIAAHPFSSRSEEYRQLRGSLRFLSPGVDHKVFVISSSVPSEGKSSTAANLAAVLAAAGESVCLVEADLRRPSLGGLLDLEGDVGLSTVLSGDASLAEVTQEWGEHGLKVILSGALPPNPSELLESARAAETFAAISQAYSVVIVDSPPINAVADAAALSKLLGGVVLVVRAKQVQVRELRRAVEQLAAVDVHIHGFVLNGAVGLHRNRGYYRNGINPVTPSSTEHGPDSGPVEQPAEQGDGSEADPAAITPVPDVDLAPAEPDLDPDPANDGVPAPGQVAPDGHHTAPAVGDPLPVEPVSMDQPSAPQSPVDLTESELRPVKHRPSRGSSLTGARRS